MKYNATYYINTILQQHDSEYDSNPADPLVTWAEKLLAECILELQKRIELLEIHNKILTSLVEHRQ